MRLNEQQIKDLRDKWYDFGGHDINLVLDELDRVRGVLEEIADDTKTFSIIKAKKDAREALGQEEWE